MVIYKNFEQEKWTANWIGTLDPHKHRTSNAFPFLEREKEPRWIRILLPDTNSMLIYRPSTDPPSSILPFANKETIPSFWNKLPLPTRPAIVNRIDARIASISFTFSSFAARLRGSLARLSLPSPHRSIPPLLASSKVFRYLSLFRRRPQRNFIIKNSFKNFPFRD